MNAFDLTGKVALVTGGSQGLGLGMARALACAGAEVVLAARTEEKLGAAVAHIVGDGGRAHAVVADLREVAGVERMVAEAVALRGRLDVLVTSAATQVRKPAIEVTPQDWDEVINVNLRAVFFSCQFAARAMREQGGGKIVNVASLTAVGAWPNVAPYAASKGGVVQLTKAFAREWAPYRINVNAIGPGTFKTELTTAIYRDPVRTREIESRIPLGRVGIPDDLGGAAVFLASSASDYITGQVLYVDGGYLVT